MIFDYYTVNVGHSNYQILADTYTSAGFSKHSKLFKQVGISSKMLHRPPQRGRIVVPSAFDIPDC